MQRYLEILLVYTTALIQGLVLVSLPAASSVFCDPHQFNYSSSQYGTLFIPQVVMSMAAAFLAPRLSLVWGLKKVYQLGIVLNFMSMFAMASSQLFVKTPLIAYGCLLLSTAAVGAAFGTTLPMINVYAQRFFPKNPAGALTGLHTLLGTGTAIAPVLVVILVKGAGWWVMPVLSLIILIIILMSSFFIPLDLEVQSSSSTVKAKFVFSAELKLFMLIVFLYGFCETIFSNWSIIYLSKDKGLALDQASYALSVFWAAVTVGRLIVSVLSRWVSPNWFYRILPIIIALSLWLVTNIHSAIMGIVCFGLAGLACSAFFPLTFSFAQSRNPSSAEIVAGLLMVFYMIGYGCGSYGIGMLMQLTGVSLQGIYQSSVLVAIGIIALSGILTVTKKEQV